MPYRTVEVDRRKLHIWRCLFTCVVCLAFSFTMQTFKPYYTPTHFKNLWQSLTACIICILSLCFEKEFELKREYSKCISQRLGKSKQPVVKLMTYFLFIPIINIMLIINININYKICERCFHHTNTKDGVSLNVTKDFCFISRDMNWKFNCVSSVFHSLDLNHCFNLCYLVIDCTTDWHYLISDLIDFCVHLSFNLYLKSARYYPVFESLLPGLFWVHKLQFYLVIERSLTMATQVWFRATTTVLHCKPKVWSTTGCQT